jgi:hypothetical protein
MQTTTADPLREEHEALEVREHRINPAHVRGWAIDADPENDPVYPMKRRNNGEHAGYSWERPPQQPVDVEVLQSNERPIVTAVFGTSSPPSGVSGSLRRWAFRYSESSYGHWLPLMLADRVNVVEGIASDLAHGHIPNLFSEAGLKEQWKHNPKSRVVFLLAGAAVATGAVLLLRRRSKA